MFVIIFLWVVVDTINFSFLRQCNDNIDWCSLFKGLMMSLFLGEHLPFVLKIL